jgi:hypothetical protein
MVIRPEGSRMIVLAKTSSKLLHYSGQPVGSLWLAVSHQPVRIQAMKGIPIFRGFHFLHNSQSRERVNVEQGPEVIYLKSLLGDATRINQRLVKTQQTRKMWNVKRGGGGVKLSLEQVM